MTTIQNPDPDPEEQFGDWPAAKKAKTLLAAAELMRMRANMADQSGSWWTAAEASTALESHAEGVHVAGMTPALAGALAEWLHMCGVELRDSGELTRCAEPAAVNVAAAIASIYMQGEL